MINLKPQTEPYDLDLPYGIVVTVQPLTTAGMLTAQAAARKAADKEIEKSGGELDKEIRDGLYQAHLIYELATRNVKAMKGVELNGAEAPATSENIRAVMDLYPVGERFYYEFTFQQTLMTLSKNVSRLSASGTSKEAEGRDTAKDAKA